MIQIEDMTLFDNSSLSTYREGGPRRWYYEYYRRWISEGPKEFKIRATDAGTAIHTMMDIYWQDPSAGPEPAWDAFVEEWNTKLGGGFAIDNLDPEFEASIQPYAPSTIREVIEDYDHERRQLLSSIELIQTERPFVVPLTPDDPTLFYVGRMDKVFRHQGQLKCADHKTTASYVVRPKGYPHLRPAWKASWAIKTQMRGYLYAIKQEFGVERTVIWVDGILLNAETRDFCLEPIECVTASLDYWLWMTHNTIKEIQEQIQAVEAMRKQGTASSADYLPAFPCYCSGMYCPYAGLCKANDNPERWVPQEPPPPGFMANTWAPFRVSEVTKAFKALEEQK